MTCFLPFFEGTIPQWDVLEDTSILQTGACLSSITSEVIATLHIRSYSRQSFAGSRDAANETVSDVLRRSDACDRVRTIGGPEQLVIQVLPDPKPKSDQVLIDVKAFGGNHAEPTCEGENGRRRPSSTVSNESEQ